MSEKGGTVTVDAEEYLKLLDELTDMEKRLRALGSQGFRGAPGDRRDPRPASNPNEKAEPAMVVDLDISGIHWKTKDSQPAGLDVPWCWAFSETKDGGVIRETMQLLQALDQYGKVRIGEYEISLGGRDGNLLNRRRLKK